MKSEARLRSRRKLAVSSAILAISAVAVEQGRAAGSDGWADFALMLLLLSSLATIVYSLAQSNGAFSAWLIAGSLHAGSAAISYLYFHLFLYSSLQAPPSRTAILKSQAKALVGFVLVIGVACMVGSGLRKIARGTE